MYALFININCVICLPQVWLSLRPTNFNYFEIIILTFYVVFNSCFDYFRRAGFRDSLANTTSEQKKPF